MSQTAWTASWVDVKRKQLHMYDQMQVSSSLHFANVLSRFVRDQRHYEGGNCALR